MTIFSSVALKADELTRGQLRVARDVLDALNDLAQSVSLSNSAPMISKRNRAASPGGARGEGLRPHNVVVIDGGRGTGKTSLLLTLHHLMSDANEDKIDKYESQKKLGENSNYDLKSFIRSTASIKLTSMDGMKNIYPLPVICPDLRDGRAFSLMEDVFALLDHELRSRVQGDGSDDSYESLTGNERGSASPKEAMGELRRDLRRKVWSGWLAAHQIGEATLSQQSMDFDDFVRQRADHTRVDQFRHKSFCDLVDKFLDMVDCRMLGVFIDDSDLVPDAAHDIAEALRLYLSHPRIVTILCVHWSSFATNILTSQLTGLLTPLQPLLSAMGTELDPAKSPGGTTQSAYSAALKSSTGIVRRLGRQPVTLLIKHIDEQVLQYLSKLMPPPLRFAISDRMTDEDVCRFLHQPALQETRARGDAPLEPGRWLWRHRYRDLFQRLTPRDLVQIRFWIERDGLERALDVEHRALTNLPSTIVEQDALEAVCRVVEGSRRGGANVVCSTDGPPFITIDDDWQTANEFTLTESIHVDIAAFMIDAKAVSDRRGPENVIMRMSVGQSTEQIWVVEAQHDEISFTHRRFLRKYLGDRSSGQLPKNCLYVRDLMNVAYEAQRAERMISPDHGDWSLERIRPDVGASAAATELEQADDQRLKNAGFPSRATSLGAQLLFQFFNAWTLWRERQKAEKGAPITPEERKVFLSWFRDADLAGREAFLSFVRAFDAESTQCNILRTAAAQEIRDAFCVAAAPWATKARDLVAIREAEGVTLAKLLASYLNEKPSDDEGERDRLLLTWAIIDPVRTCVEEIVSMDELDAWASVTTAGAKVTERQSPEGDFSLTDLLHGIGKAKFTAFVGEIRAGCNAVGKLATRRKSELKRNALIGAWTGLPIHRLDRLPKATP